MILKMMTMIITGRGDLQLNWDPNNGVEFWYFSQAQSFDSVRGEGRGRHTKSQHWIEVVSKMRPSA
jgi:hypothetical protein